jgi:NAD(P)-dependent dehydrogenase (short-subunit alcohol dehydrogenase family)
VQMNALVTGTSRGLGLALAEGIAARGGFVVGVGRTGLPVARNGQVMVQGDLTEQRTVRDLCSAIGDRPLDLLVHNAAVGGRSRELSQEAVAEIRRALEVGVIGPAALTVELLPSLRRAEHPLVLLIGSRMGDVSFNRSLPPEVRSASYAYRIAKAAVEMLSVALARELGDAATVLCVDPGPMATAMGRPGAERDPVAVADELLDSLGDLRCLATGSVVALMDRRVG